MLVTIYADLLQLCVISFIKITAGLISRYDLVGRIYPIEAYRENNSRVFMDTNPT